METERSSENDMMFAIWRGDQDSAINQLNELINREPEKKLEYELAYYTYLCKFQKNQEAVEKLQSLADSATYSKQSSQIFETIGEFYQITDQYDKAIHYFEQAAKKSITSQGEVNAILAKTQILEKTDQVETAFSLLQQSLNKFSDTKCLSMLYDRISEISHLLGDEIVRCAALEKAVQYNPTDSDLLFKAAYAQSEVGIPHLALHNYEIQLRLNKTAPVERNNYAIEIGKFGLHGKSVDQYFKSWEQGNTLAAANLGGLFINQGFGDHAEKNFARCTVKRGLPPKC